MIRNDNIKERVGIYLIVLKIMETRLRWFRCVEKKMCKLYSKNI